MAEDNPGGKKFFFREQNFDLSTNAVQNLKSINLNIYLSIYLYICAHVCVVISFSRKVELCGIFLFSPRTPKTAQINGA